MGSMEGGMPWAPRARGKAPTEAANEPQQGKLKLRRTVPVPGHVLTSTPLGAACGAEAGLAGVLNGESATAAARDKATEKSSAALKKLAFPHPGSATGGVEEDTTDAVGCVPAAFPWSEWRFVQPLADPVCFGYESNLQDDNDADPSYSSNSERKDFAPLLRWCRAAVCRIQ